MADILKIIGIIGILAGGVLIIYGFNNPLYFFDIYLGVSSAISGLFIIAFGEIIAALKAVERHTRLLAKMKADELGILPSKARAQQSGAAPSKEEIKRRFGVN